MLKTDFKKAKLSERELALCVYAQNLTLNPGDSQQVDITQPLKSAGLSDAGTLDASLVVSYFNFVNRMVLSLEVQVEQDAGGYKY